MKKGDKGGGIWGLIVVLIVVWSVFSSAVSAENVTSENIANNATNAIILNEMPKTGDIFNENISASEMGITYEGSSGNKDNIISDLEYRDYQSMSLAEIQSWLENPRWGDGYLGRPSYLATYRTTDWLGVERSAAEIIYNAARDYQSQGYQVSPEVILTTLQKEQSLITDPDPSNTQLNWAMGYGSYGQWMGFGAQVDAGGWQLGYNYNYIETHGSKNGWGVGISKQTLDGVTIIPQNIATACLYDYTPHAGAGWGGAGGGNYLFWDLYYNKFHFVDGAAYPQPSISASEYETEINVGETDWVKFTVTNDGTEHTSSWGIQVKVGDGLELVQHSSYPWNQGNMCNGKAAEWYKTSRLNPGDSAYIWVGIKGKSASSYESVWYTAWMYDPDEQPVQIQYAHPVYEVPCNREYAEYGVEVTLAPQIELTPSSHSFGNIEVGSCSFEYSFTLTNTGGGTATGTVSRTGTHASQFTITQGSGSFSLGAGASKTIKVKFCPTSTGAKTATLYADGSNCNDDSSSLSGTGTQAPSIDLSPSSHNFGNIEVGSCSFEYSFTLTNTGGGTATGSVSLTGTHASQFTITQGSGSFSLGAGASKTIKVKFCPDSTGAKTATLYADGTNCNDDTSSLSGTGTQAPSIDLSPSSHNFGNIEVGSCSFEYSFTLTNTGGGTATGSVSLTGTHASQFTITQGSGSFSLGAGASKTIKVKFCPDSTGSKSATLYADGTNCNDDTSSLSGTGVLGPELSYSPTSRNFGDECEGETDSTTFEIWNSGTGTLTYSLSESCGWVDVHPTSGSSTGEHDTITVDIDTTGLSEGSHTCDISISSNDGSGTFTVTVNVVPCEEPILSYSPTSHNFGDKCEGETDSTTFEIWNPGTGTLTYSLSESCGWIDVHPTSGSSTGEHDTITVDIGTTGLSEGSHTCDISISSNGGSGTFTVTVNIIPPEEPSISISTDKTSYKAGDTMHVGLAITNLGDSQPVRFAIWLQRPDGGIYVLTYTSVTLPAGLDYNNPNFMVFGLPNIPSGIYTWHATLIEPTGPIEFIDHDTAEWEFVPTGAPTEDIVGVLEQAAFVIDFDK